MPTSQEDLLAKISACSPEVLQEILLCAKLSPSPEASPTELATQITDSIWKEVSSPAQKIFSPPSLEEILQSCSQQLDMKLEDGDGCHQLERLTGALLQSCTPPSMEDLPEDLQNRINQSNWPQWTGLGVSASAASTAWLSHTLLRWSSGKWLRWIRLIPKLGPAIIAVRSALGATMWVSGPVAIAAALWTLNRSLGARWSKVFPLLLGTGLALQTLKPVWTVEESASVD